MDKRKIILASGSPRRRELLGELLGGYDAELIVDPVSDVDESYPPSTPALDVAPMLARRKLDAYMDRRHPDSSVSVVSADTVVIIDGEVLGKPADPDEARRMLHRLSGNTHLVVTGVAVARDNKIDCRRQVTEVTFAPLTDHEIDLYIDRYRPFDKAGSYGIQEWIGQIGIERINGDYYNVVGLPLRLLHTMLS